jgi:hypothetical protein
LIEGGVVSIANQKFKIKNNPKTRKRGQGAQCPDRLFNKKRLLIQIVWE